jgi:pimeloyl-ACP methyl ester carboxylesterase
MISDAAEFHAGGDIDGAHNIRVPTLVVRGAQSDLVSPDGVQEFVDAVPGARYMDVADAGHMVAGDQNDHFQRRHPRLPPDPLTWQPSCVGR